MGYNGAYPKIIDHVEPQIEGSGGASEKRRICILTQDIFGPVRNAGIGTAYRHAAEFCAGQGHDVTIIFTQGAHAHDRTIEYWIDFYRERGITFIPADAPARGLKTSSNSLRWSFAGYQALAKHGPFDIVHSSECGGSPYFPLIAKRVLGEFDSTLFCIKTSSPNLWSREGNWENLPIGTGATITAMERLCVEWADLVIAPSQHMLNWMVDHGYKLGDRLCVHPNIMPAVVKGAATEGAAAPDGHASAMTELCFFGRLEPRKGLELFAEGVERIAPELRAGKVRVTFLGKQVQAFDFDKFLKEFNARTGLAATVLTTLDSVQVNEYLTTPGRIAAIPSLLDNSPFTVYECLVNGIPFIASDVGGIAELVHPDDRDALLFKPRPGALAARLGQILRHGLAPGRLAFDPAVAQAQWALFHREARYRRGDGTAGTAAPAGQPAMLSLGPSGMADIDELRGDLQATAAEWIFLHDPGVTFNRATLASLTASVVDPEVAGLAPFMVVKGKQRELLPSVLSTGESILEWGYIAPGALLLRRRALVHALDRLDALGLIQRTFLQEIALLATELGMIAPCPNFVVQSAGAPGGPINQDVARNRLLVHLTRRYPPEVANRLRLYSELSARSDQLRKLKPILAHVRGDIAFVRELWAETAA